MNNIAVSDITAIDTAEIPQSGAPSRLAGFIASTVGVALLAIGAIAVIATMGALVPFIPEWLFWTGTLALLLLVSWLARIAEEALRFRLSPPAFAPQNRAGRALTMPKLTKI